MSGPVSSLLEQAAEVVATWNSDRDADRERCAALLEAVVHNLERAASVWESFVAESPAEGERFAFIVWFGPERARELHRVHLEQKALGRELADLTQLPFCDSLGISDEIDVESAYAELGPEETGEARATAALQTMRTRREAVASVLGRL